MYVDVFNFFYSFIALEEHAKLEWYHVDWKKKLSDKQITRTPTEKRKLT